MKTKKRFLGILLVLTMITPQFSIINVQANTDSTPTSIIDLNKTVEKNQWGVDEEFIINYTIQPRDIPQDLVPKELYHKNGADISLVLDKSGSMAWGLDGSKTLYNKKNYVEDPSGTLIKFDYGGIKYGRYVSDKWYEYIFYNNNYYRIYTYYDTKYLGNNYILNLTKKYKEVSTVEQSRISIVKAAANAFIDKFSNYSNVRIGLINYDSYAKVNNILTDSSEFENIKSNINTTPNGGTNIGDGLRKAYWQLADNSTNDKKKFIVLLTDGEPTNYSYCYNYPNSVYVEDDREINNSNIAGGGNNDNDGKATEYANFIAKKIAEYKNPSDKGTSINSFMIAFSKDATNNKLAGISKIANNDKSGFYKEATSIEDINEVYDKIAETILSDLSIYGLQLKETFPSGIDIVAVSNGLKIDSINHKVIGDIGNINYTLDKNNKVFKAKPLNFWVKLKGTKSGDYILGENSSKKSTSFVNYKDIDSKQVNPAPSFPSLNINIYNNKPPMMNATLTNGANSDNFNLNLNVDMPSNIVVKDSKDNSTEIATQDHLNDPVTDNATYTLSIPTKAIQHNINNNVYSLSLEASSKKDLKTIQTIPLISTQLITNKTDASIKDILIQTETNSTIKEVKLNGSIILTDKITDKNGAFYCNNVALIDGNNTVSITVVNGYKNTTQIITNLKLLTAPIINANEDWTKAPQKITIEAGVDRAEYKLSGATTQDWKIYNSDFEISNEGQTKIEARTIDKAGNTSSVSEKTVKIDKTHPTGTVTQSKSELTHENIILTFKGNDTLSGVKKIKPPHGNWFNVDTVNYTATECGTYTFEVEDNAGNTHSESCTITNVDKSIIKTGLFINNQFKKQDSDISIVNSFNVNLAFEIENIKNQSVTFEIADTDIINISNVKIYSISNLQKPIKTSPISNNTFTISDLPTDKINNYIFVFEAKALKISSQNITTLIKINDSPRAEKHTIKIVKLPTLQ